jgi:hypothetical protein
MNSSVSTILQCWSRALLCSSSTTLPLEHPCTSQANLPAPQHVTKRMAMFILTLSTRVGQFTCQGYKHMARFIVTLSTHVRYQHGVAGQL